MIYLIRYLFCILVLGRKPYPIHEHNWSKWEQLGLRHQERRCLECGRYEMEIK